MTTSSSHPARSHLTLLDPPAGRDVAPGEGHSPASDVEAVPAAVASAPTRPASRRRTGWFEANPGCFARVALAACGTGVAAGGATAWAAWRAWRSSPVRRARAALRFSRRAWRGYRRLRRGLRR